MSASGFGVSQVDRPQPQFKRPTARETIVDVDIVDGEGLLRERRIPPES